MRFNVLGSLTANGPEGQVELRAPKQRAVLALWRGPLLAEFAGQPWVRDAAVRLDERRAFAVETRLQALTSVGGSVDIVADLEAAVQMYPLREALWALLMLTQFRLGRQA